MLAHCRRRKPGTKWAWTQACVMGYLYWTPQGVLDPFLGEICFHLRHLDAETVSHEMTHATVCWARRKGIDLGKIHEDRDIDERVAWTQGYLVGQFWDRLYKMQDRGTVRFAA